MPVAIKRDPGLFVTNEKMRDFYNWPPEVFLSRVVTVTPPGGGNRIGAYFIDLSQGITMFGSTPEGPY